MATLHFDFSIGTAAVIVVPAETQGKRLAIWLQSYSPSGTAGAANVPLYVKFGQTAVAGKGFEILAGGIYTWGAQTIFDRFNLPLTAIVQTEYISLIGQGSGPTVGSIMIQTR